ncbi:bifunctional DNA primase/polymerase [Streptomyces sp. NPDC102415]|uniref:bifunctional DNA primase/polymerase n=1 Tax=Streptomyces sp. NPDC102415 TaxID=3366173 RepID=UPI00381C3C6B
MWEPSTHARDQSSSPAAFSSESRIRCPTIRAASGGAHLYLSVPAATRLHNTAGTLAPLVDNRAWGGCVVAGSTVNGHTYAVDGPALINPLPGCLRLALMPPPATQKRPPLRSVKSVHPCARSNPGAGTGTPVRRDCPPTRTGHRPGSARWRGRATPPCWRPYGRRPVRGGRPCPPRRRSGCLS